MSPRTRDGAKAVLLFVMTAGVAAYFFFPRSESTETLESPKQGAPDPVRHFDCEDKPSKGKGERGCLPSDYDGGTGAFCRSGCSSRDVAYCFFKSRGKLEMVARNAPLAKGERWSATEIGQDCFASQQECDAFRGHFGGGADGQPPVKGPCIATPVKQALSDP